MGAFRDLAGRTFGRLTAIERAGTRDGNAVWRCRCECGGEKVARSSFLLRGLTRSCGCLRRVPRLGPREEQRVRIAQADKDALDRLALRQHRSTVQVASDLLAWALHHQAESGQAGS